MAANECGGLPFSLVDDCSSHGVCTPLSSLGNNETVVANPQGFTCVCESGWTGLSDWISGEGFDCQVNILAVQILWYIVIAAYSLVTMFTVPKIIRSYQRFQTMRKQSALKGKSSRVTQNGTLFMSAIHLVITTPAAIGLAYVESQTTQRIGFDVLPTLLYLLWRSVFYLCAYVFQPYLIETIVGNTGQAAKDVVNEYKKKSVFVIGFTWSIGFIILGSLGAQNPVGYQATFIVYCLLVAVASFLLNRQAKFTRDKIVEILDKSYASVKKDSILVVKARLVRAQGTVMKQTLIIGLVHFIYAVVPYFWNKFSYFLPITILFPSILFLNVIRSLAEASKKTESSENASSAQNLIGKVTGLGRFKQNRPAGLTVDGKTKDDTTTSMQFTSEGIPIEGTHKQQIHGLEYSIAAIVGEKVVEADPELNIQKTESGQKISQRSYLPSPARMMAKINSLRTPKKSSSRGGGVVDGVGGIEGGPSSMDAIQSNDVQTSVTGGEQHEPEQHTLM